MLVDWNCWYLWWFFRNLFPIQSRFSIAICGTSDFSIWFHLGHPKSRILVIFGWIFFPHLRKYVVPSSPTFNLSYDDLVGLPFMESYWRNGRKSVLVQICALFRLHCLCLCIFFIIKHIFFTGRHFMPLDRLWSSLIISDQPWPTYDHQPHISGSSSSWSPGSLLISGHFFKLYGSSEVGLLLIFVEIQFYQLVFISAVQNFGFLLVLPGTTSIRCENSPPFHPHPLIWPLIICRGPPRNPSTTRQGHFCTVPMHFLVSGCFMLQYYYCSISAPWLCIFGLLLPGYNCSFLLDIANCCCCSLSLAVVC